MSVFVCSVFVSLPLCRLAKPPVPKPHLWSPGKWLIWKYNHSGQDFISSLSYSLFPLSSLHLSYLIHHQTNFCLVFVSYCVTFPIFLALIKTAKSSPLLSYDFVVEHSFPNMSYCALFLPALSDPFGGTEPCWALTSSMGRKRECDS